MGVGRVGAEKRGGERRGGGEEGEGESEREREYTVRAEETVCKALHQEL